MDKTSIGARMKKYEFVTKQFVLPRTPVVIRVDGKAFHTFTKRLNETTDPSCANGISEKTPEELTSELLASFVKKGQKYANIIKP